MCVKQRALKRSYGMMNFKPNLSKELLLFTDLSGFVKSIGIAPYTVASTSASSPSTCLRARRLTLRRT